MMLLVEQSCPVMNGLCNLDVPGLISILQIIMLGYLVYAFRRIARNQADTADYLRKKFGKED